MTDRFLSTPGGLAPPEFSIHDRTRGGLEMSFLEWFLLAFLFVIYVTCIFTVAVITFRNGHWILGILGIFFPVFWLIGAILPPTAEAVAEEILEA
jgi:hypothetical protein